MRARRVGLSGMLAVLAAIALGGCDDQIKRIPIFSTMSVQPSVEAYEQTSRRAVPGTMPVDGQRTYGLLAADSLLTSPITGTSEELASGAALFGTFCTPCHGAEGAGNGTVVGPNRIPVVPMLNLRSAQARSYSDGYIWGMITNGRGLMPSYRRIPADDRWKIVAHVRRLQREAPVGGGE
jgi:mono/diheme cytochrome c family protein